MSSGFHRVTTSRSTAVDIDHLTVRFSSSSGTELTALADFSIHADAREMVCVMGPSGCGKTTVLNAIAGFVMPSSGSVRVGGKAIVAPGPDRAVVFQDDAVFPWMTVEANIGYSLRMRNANRADSEVIISHYADLVGLTDFRTSWPRQLSGGMKKRVDLARAYAADPEVLLLDEPFGALDPLTKEHLQEELHALHVADPRTTIFVTHDMEEALFLGDRVVVMTPRPGRIADTIEPQLPRQRDMNIKTEARFVDMLKQIRRTLTEGLAHT